MTQESTLVLRGEMSLYVLHREKGRTRWSVKANLLPDRRGEDREWNHIGTVGELPDNEDELMSLLMGGTDAPSV
jgi:hypothetical protein